MQLCMHVPASIILLGPSMHSEHPSKLASSFPHHVKSYLYRGTSSTFIQTDRRGPHFSLPGLLRSEETLQHLLTRCADVQTQTQKTTMMSTSMHGSVTHTYTYSICRRLFVFACSCLTLVSIVRLARCGLPNLPLEVPMIREMS